MTTRLDLSSLRTRSLGDISNDELTQAEKQLLLAAGNNMERKKSIRSFFGEIRQERDHLRSLNVSSAEIRSQMRERISQFEIADQRIAGNSHAYVEGKTETLSGYRTAATNIEAARPNFTPFSRKKADGSLPASCSRFLQDRQVENLVRARVVAATLNAVGTVVKETAATVLGCRGEEGRKNCKAVLGYAKTLAKETAAVALGCRGEGRENCQAVLKFVKTQAEKAKPTLKRMMSGHAITQRLGELGVEPKKSDQWFHVSAEQYIEDSTALTLTAAIAVGPPVAFKLFKTVFPSRIPTNTLSGKPARREKRQISQQHEHPIESATETTSFTNAQGRKTTTHKERSTFCLPPPPKPTSTPFLTSGKTHPPSTHKAHSIIYLPPPPKPTSTPSLTSGKARSTTTHKAHPTICPPPPPKPPSTPSLTSWKAHSTTTHTAHPTICPPPPPNPPSTPFGEDTSDLIGPIRLATSVPRHENPIPRYIDVDRVWSAEIIRSYYRSGQTSPIQEFVQNTIHQPFKITTMETRGSGNTLHIVHDVLGNPMVVVKEFSETGSDVSGFVPEIVANTILRAENFTDLSILPILDFGMYTTPDGAEKGLVMFPWSDGKTLDYLFKEHLPIHAKRVGRAIGEMGAVESPLPVCDQYLKEITLKMSEITEDVFFHLNRELLIRAPLTMKRVEMITNDMLWNPGRAGPVHGDAHASNIMIDESQVTLIDSGTLMASVNRAGIPFGMPVFDQQRVVVAMHLLGAHFGYAQAEVAQNVAEFLTGYREMMPFTSAPAERYAHLFHEIMVLNELVRGQYDRQLVCDAVERVNAVFGQTRFKSSPRKMPPGPRPKTKDLLPAERINRNLLASLQFPPASEFTITPLEQLHEIWTLNQETLLGIIAKKKIPSFGLHGTSWLGMKTLMNRQTGVSIEVGDNNLFVAGTPYTANPLDQLAAFYAMVEEATDFLEKKGGMFIVDTSAAVTAEDGSISRIANILTQDTRPQRRILERMQKSSHAEELLVSVTPDNYSKVIKGVIREEDTLYPAEVIESLLSDATTSSLGILAGRLRTQEILLTVFEKLGAIRLWHSFPWEKRHTWGKLIMSGIVSE